MLKVEISTAMRVIRIGFLSQHLGIGGLALQAVSEFAINPLLRGGEKPDASILGAHFSTRFKEVANTA